MNNMIIDPALTESYPTAMGSPTAEHEGFKQELAQFCRSLTDSSVVQPNMFRLAYSPDLYLTNQVSGGTLWGDVTAASLPDVENKIFGQNRAWLKALWDGLRPTVFDFGSGHFNTLKKTDDIVGAVGGRYVAIDCNEEFAHDAASILQIRNGDLPTDWICGDYTKLHRLPQVQASETSLGLFLGCSLAQHPFSALGREGEVSFKEMLFRFHEMLGKNSILIATVDTNTSVSAATPYGTPEVKAFLANWLATVIGKLASDSDHENNFVKINGKKVTDVNELRVFSNSTYQDYETFPNSTGRVAHSLIAVSHPIHLRINGDDFVIPMGQEINISSSERGSIAAYKEEIKNSPHWTFARELSGGIDSGSRRALVLVGKGVPRTLLDRAKDQSGYRSGQRGNLNLQQSTALGAITPRRSKLQRPSNLPRPSVFHVPATA